MIREIDTIFLHCSDTPNGSTRYTINDIDDWHRARGFARTADARAAAREHLTSVGYHAVIYVDGSIVRGRADDERGAHVRGHNAHSLGVCLMGRDRYTLVQWASLAILIDDWRAKYPTIHYIRGHREVDPHKTCPGFDVQTWLRQKLTPDPCHVLPQPR